MDVRDVGRGTLPRSSCSSVGDDLMEMTTGVSTPEQRVNALSTPERQWIGSQTLHSGDTMARHATAMLSLENRRANELRFSLLNEWWISAQPWGRVFDIYMSTAHPRNAQNLPIERHRPPLRMREIPAFEALERRLHESLEMAMTGGDELAAVARLSDEYDEAEDRSWV